MTMQTEVPERRILDEIAASLPSLGPEEMRKYGYDVCHMTLLYLFGDSRQPEEIERMAVDCMRNWVGSAKTFAALIGAAAESREVPADLRDLVDSIRFKPGAIELITELQQTSGVLLSTFHWGAFRFISVGLALRKKGVTVLMDRITHEPQKTSLHSMEKRMGVANDFDQNLRFVMAEERSTLVNIYRVLVSKGLVIMYPDGNTGWDGPKGADARTGFTFAGKPIKVKNGVSRMALLFQVPIVVMKAEYLKDGSILIGVQKVIVPPLAKSELAPAFIASSLRTIYAELEQWVMERPEHWESSRQFHRWRENFTGPKVIASHATEAYIRQSLDDGLDFELDRSRLAWVNLSEQEMWMDAQTMCAYSSDPHTAQIVRQIGDWKQFAASWKGLAPVPEKQAGVVRLLALLFTRGLLKPLARSVDVAGKTLATPCKRAPDVACVQCTCGSRSSSPATTVAFADAVKVAATAQTSAIHVTHLSR